MNEKNIRLVKSDTQARRITFQDVKEGGYTTPTQVVVLNVDNPFGTKKNGTVRYQNTLDLDHPEYLVIPTAGQISDGIEFTVDSYTLGVTKEDQGYYSFRDGVLNVNYYVSDDTLEVTGVKDTNWLIGSGFEPILEKYDSVIIGKEVYQIMKGFNYPSNAGTVIYLDRDLTEDVSEVHVAERSNLKVLNNTVTKTTIARGACIMADPLYRNNGILEKQNGVFKVIRNNEASRILFEREDYAEADRLLTENVEIGKFLNLI